MRLNPNQTLSTGNQKGTGHNLKSSGMESSRTNPEWHRYLNLSVVCCQGLKQINDLRNARDEGAMAFRTYNAPHKQGPVHLFDLLGA